jgi:hypothetical protein
MADPGPDESCQVSLLIPHPRRIAVLVADPTRSFPTLAQTNGAELPTVVVPAEEPLLSEILAFVQVVDTATTAVLRQVITSSGGAEEGGERRDNEGLTLLVEFDAGPAQTPDGWTWLDLDDDAIARLEPETTRAAVASWARERATGWSPLRPAWSHPGWLARASAWMVEQMAAHGRPAISTPQQHQLWNLSSVLRCRSTDGDVFLKCSADIFRHEAVVTDALATGTPDLLPDVIAVDRDEGWLLMRDLGAPELGDQDESSWHHGVKALAAIQRSWLQRTDELLELGLPVRSMADLAAAVETMADDARLMDRASPDLRRRWSAAAPALADSCRRLDEIGPGPTLVHGDFHPWNVVFGAGSTHVFDWSDAAVSHPFVDLATYVFRTPDIAVRRQLVDSGVRAWSTEGPEELISEAAALGLVVGALYQVQTYRALLPTLMNGGADDDMVGADLDWMNRSLTRHLHGIESPT